MSSRKVWVITTVFNRYDSLRNMVSCLQSQTHDNWELVIVDHSPSPDKDLEFGFKVKVIEGSSSDWWTGAVNTGIRHAISKCEDDDLIVLQNDDSIFDNKFLENLVAPLGFQSDKVVGAVAVDSHTRKIIHADLHFSFLRATYLYSYKGKFLDFADGGILESDVLKGRGVVFPVQFFLEHGLLDEALPQYKSDHEITFRARAAGYKLYVCPKAITETILDTQISPNSHVTFVSNLWSQLTDRQSTSNIRDAVYYYKKCFGLPASIYLTIVHTLRVVISCAKAAVK